MTEPAADADMALWTPEQVCQALACRRSWLYDQVQAGRFPVIRLGRQLRFRPAEIATYLDTHTHVVASEPPPPGPARAPRRRRRPVHRADPPPT